MTLYRVDLPYTSPPKSLNLNARVHWAQKAKAAAEVRQTVTWLVKAAGVPKCEYIAVQVFWAPGDRRRRDEDNWALFTKPIFDAISRGGRSDLVGLDLVPDDTAKYMDKRPFRILTPDDTNEVGMWLSITTFREVPESELPGQIDINDLLEGEAS